MWYEDFLSAYHNKPADHLSEYYDRWSVFVEMIGDGGWTKPVTGTRRIMDRLVALSLIGCQWPIETCQRTRTGGMLAVLVTVNGARQILIVYRSTDQLQRVLVRNHFYLTPTGNDGVHEHLQKSFRRRFECWAESQDRDTLERYQIALFNGLTVARDYYASSAGRPGHRPRWHQYDKEARFSYTRNGQGGGRIYIGLQSIRKRFKRLALDYRYARLRTINTCWTMAPGERKCTVKATVVLVTGTVPEVTGPGNRAHREFMQFFVIDTPTLKILNDILCFELFNVDITHHRPSHDGGDSSLLSLQSSPSSLSSSPSSLSSAPSSSSSLLFYKDSLSTSSLSTSSSSLSPSPSPSPSSSMSSLLSIDSHSPSPFTMAGCNKRSDRLTADDLYVLRSRITTSVLKVRMTMVTTIEEHILQPQKQQLQKQQKNQTIVNTSTTAIPALTTKLNPRQLFIGCVPLHVKYGQLKLLFEQFGEVTYVKVYEGYNKHTGVKMLHNYAFLFFKDEASVDKAIAASPVPLDHNWNLNVSRPHHHSNATNGSG